MQQGSYSSSGPAGGRPASGLSRRRTQFRGPPPSFYRNGGWGEHSEKRQSAQDNASRAGEAAKEAFEAGRTRGEEPRAGGMGPGQHPFGHWSDVRHWDREGHLRTHQRAESRTQRRRKDGDIIPNTLPPSMLAQFFFIGGIISLGIFVPSYIFERLTSTKNRDKRT